ncbi:DUF6993 domain-containing protein [Agromyces subbeticus]|uniref:DUF6993 domain-containing protein n=1 Tax=Agromyces subbeticus TaxID=293890 RepID=UPI0003B779F4|nr:hypothetical protein [Agromyces subbeticus]
MRAANIIVPVVLGAAALALTGCAADPEPAPVPETTPPVAPAVLVPDGDAEANLPFFTQVASGVSASGTTASRDFTSALITAGFDRAAMQVTPDETPTGLAADSVSFSVLWKGDCLIGQNGAAVGGLTTVVDVPLDGACLAGPTPPVE